MMGILHINRSKAKEIYYRLRPKYKQKYTTKHKSFEFATIEAYKIAVEAEACEVWQITHWDNEYYEPDHTLMARIMIKKKTQY